MIKSCAPLAGKIGTLQVDKFQQIKPFRLSSTSPMSTVKSGICLLMMFVNHVHSHKSLWFGNVSNIGAYQYRKSIAITEM